MNFKIIFLILFVPISLLSQEFSKLNWFRKELKNPQSEHKRFEIQQNLVDIYRIYNPDSCIFYTNKNLQLIKKNKWTHKTGKTLLGLVSYFAEKNDIKNGFYFNKQSLYLNQQNKDDYSLADNYYMFGRLYHLKGDHAEAVKNYLKAIDFGNTSKNYWIVGGAHRSLAFLYLDESNKEKAYENIKKAIKTAQISKSEESLGFCYGVLAELERNFNKKKEAEINFAKSYEYFKNTQNEYGLAWLYTNWSLLDVTKLGESYEMQMKAQTIWNKIAPNHYMSVVNHYNTAYSYMDFYTYFDEYKNQSPFPKNQLLSKAQEEFETSKIVAEKNNNQQWIMFNYLGMSELSMVKKDLNGYAQNIKEYYAIRDSIYSQSRKNEIAKLESQKVVSQKNKEIALNKLIIDTKEKQKWYYLLGILLLLVIGILLFFLYRQSRKNSNRLQKLNHELDGANKVKTQFFGILNHDLRSPVVGLLNFLHLQKEAPEMMDEETKSRIQAKTISASEKLLQQMEDLLLWSKGQMEHFSLDIKNVEVKTIFNDIQNAFSWAENIQINFVFPENMTIETDLEYLKTITRNLTNNAIKVLESKEGDKIISWTAWQDEKGSYLTIKDNGTGASQEKFKALFDDQISVGSKHGLGLHLIRDLCKAIQMTVEVNSKEGFGSEITLKTEKV